jgi:hypothetical protein
MTNRTRSPMATFLLRFSEVVSICLSFGVTFSDRSCHIYLGIQALSAPILQMAVQILLILRRECLSIVNLPHSWSERGLYVCSLCALRWEHVPPTAVTFPLLRGGGDCVFCIRFCLSVYQIWPAMRRVLYAGGGHWIFVSYGLLTPVVFSCSSRFYRYAAPPRWRSRLYCSF